MPSEAAVPSLFSRQRVKLDASGRSNARGWMDGWLAMEYNRATPFGGQRDATPHYTRTTLSRWGEYHFHSEVVHDFDSEEYYLRNATVAE
ncbi:unnamed protein product [Calypogeia fissa]